MAREAVSAYLRYGFDESTFNYYGQLRVADGSPVLNISSYPYQPREHANLWEPLFPAHDYPAALAETCLSLLERTQEHQFEEGVRRWAHIIREATPANRKRGAYAEHYGRNIHFLMGAAQFLGDRDLEAQARSLADEAISVLFAHGMLRGHPGEDRYDAVDGVGFLLLALLYLETGQRVDYLGFGF